MDVLSLLIAVIIMILAFQYNQTWIVFIVIAGMIVWFRNLQMSIVLLVIAGMLYFATTAFNLQSIILPVIIGLVVLALIVGLVGKPKQPEYFPSDLYGMGGGMEGFGGMGGLGGY